MLDLIISVCLVATSPEGEYTREFKQPLECTEKIIPVYDDISERTCRIHAMPTVAQWIGSHQEYKIGPDGYRCVKRG